MSWPDNHPVIEYVCSIMGVKIVYETIGISSLCDVTDEGQYPSTYYPVHINTLKVE